MNAAFSPPLLQRLLKTENVGRCVLHLASVSSTMDAAREEAENGAPHGMIVVADEQTRGQGRRGRHWVSPPGNLYVTLILRPAAWNARTLAMVAPLATCEAIDAVANVRSSIKWPNDVLIEGRKVGGVLIDVHLGRDGIEYALVGVGINVALDPSQHDAIRGIATSLAAESGENVSRERLLATFLNRFEKLYAAAVLDDSVYDAWRARLETLGRQVRVQFGDGVEEGVAEDVDADGNLLLRRADGSVIALSAGDVTLAPIDR
jgi:BirA family transcriptional regulator, biotin operon repressor / biotin---[acetyl-CoA-carboxylase] ligase